MIIVMKPGSSDEELNNVVQQIQDLGYKAHVMRGVERNVIGALGDERGKKELFKLESTPGVDKVIPILSPYKLAAKELQATPSIVKVDDDLIFNGANIPVIAGPCSVESEEQIVESAIAVKQAGANALRGGAYKPRTSTYSFQGHGEDGLKMLATAKKETGLPIVTEIMDHHMLDVILKYADILQIGARNMQNYTLLKAVGNCDKPILLKRGMSATVEELLLAAEYILAEGNERVILCERGIRTYETATRNTLDLNAVPALKLRTHLPVIVDPSHGTGVWNYVAPMSKASIAAGADGLIIEVHPQPDKAMSDGGQSLKPKVFAQLMKDLSRIAAAVDRTVGNAEFQKSISK